jgi:hypothetical protein
MNIEKNSLFKYFGEAWLVMGLNTVVGLNTIDCIIPKLVYTSGVYRFFL